VDKTEHVILQKAFVEIVKVPEVYTRPLTSGESVHPFGEVNDNDTERPSGTRDGLLLDSVFV
jgi:hypothetical protein